MRSTRDRWIALQLGVAVIVVVLGIAVFGGVQANGRELATPSAKCLPSTKRVAGGHGLILPPYAVTSPLNATIPADAAVDPSSSTFVQGISDASGGQLVLSLGLWTVPVYYADASTPRVRVPLTAYWAHGKITAPVPIPTNARPDPGADAHMVVVDRGADCEYDFFRAQQSSDGRWTAAWMNTIRLSSNGIFPKGNGARASGFALLAGLIFPAELRRGEIRHALAFNYPFTKAGGPVKPATSSDGASTIPAALPEGVKVRLDPTLDLATLPLAPYERTIARALQVYGMYLVDHGGSVGLYAVNPISYAGAPYRYLVPEDVYPSLKGIPIDRLQVLLPPGR